MVKARKPRAKRTAARTAAHPPYIDMVTTAITAMKDRGGSSRQAIEKYIKANNRVTGDISTHLKMALKRGVKSGRLLHTKGTGASGSFKVGKVAAAPKKKKPAKKRTAAKKPRKKASTPKKRRTPKKTGAKKATKKKSTAKKTKSPAKRKTAKKPKAKSAAKKRTKSPKKRAAPKKKTARKPKAKAAAKK